MLKSKYILFAVFLLAAAGVSAQKAERDYIRKGNRLFNDSVFVDAEVNYRKALEANPKSTVSMYNLGNTLSQQQKFQDAMEQYVSASKIEKDKMKLAHIYHNMGDRDDRKRINNTQYKKVKQVESVSLYIQKKSNFEASDRTGTGNGLVYSQSEFTDFGRGGTD